MRFLFKSFQQVSYIQFGIQVFGIGFIFLVLILYKIFGFVLENFPLLVVVFQRGKALHPIAGIEFTSPYKRLLILITYRENQQKFGATI